MKTVARWVGIAVATMVALAFIAILGVFGVSEWVLRRSYAAQPETLVAPTPAQLADVDRQAKVLGCISCHGEGLGGRVFLDVPNVIRLVAPNLPAIAERASDRELAVAIRQGIGHDGRSLFAMPSASYQKLGDGEVAALIAYIRLRPRSDGPIGGLTARPLGRLGLATGKVRPQPAKVAEFRLREPISAGPAHRTGQRMTAIYCTDCHGAALEGLEMDNGERRPDLAIVGAYDATAFRTLMRTGQAAGNREVGLMSQVSRDDFRHLTDVEIAAIHAYLKARAERVRS